jgi:hypothetical protein
LASLKDKNGTQIGDLKLLECPPSNQEDIYSENKHLGQPLKLVEIAKGYAFGRPYERVEYYYHVMWIEWEGNVAYRKGLGKVSEEAWEAQDRDLINLMLG